MSGWTITAGALALSLAMITTASPGLARERSAASQDWRNSRAQAIPESDMTLNGARAAAIRGCNGKVSSLKNYTWGTEQIDSYRACMAQHGQPE